ncbi:MAG: hypothetical protein K1X94_24505 [Sandaracinaceae bacterium]|nr:hypothetical protein [Sandaracinaceae bacterium]
MNKQNSQIAAGCSGCAALLAIMLSCVATGGVPYFNSEVERWERMRSEDIASGQMDLLLAIDDGAIAENTNYMYGSAGCAACSGFIGLLGVAGAVGLFMRSRKAES